MKLHLIEAYLSPLGTAKGKLDRTELTMGLYNCFHWENIVSFLSHSCGLFIYFTAYFSSIVKTEHKFISYILFPFPK